MTASSSINTSLLWSSVLHNEMDPEAQRAARHIKEATVPKKGFINDFSPKGRDTEILQKERNGDGEIKATQMAYKQDNYVEDPEASLKSLPQLPMESAR